VGTSGIDKAGGLTIGSDGTVYLPGTTTGNFRRADPQRRTA